MFMCGQGNELSLQMKFGKMPWDHCGTVQTC